jgi:hypothetical protein
MNKFTPAPPVSSPPTEPVGYRPFAPLAVISIVAAAAFAVILVVWGIVCFWYGAPLVLPLFVLLLPIGAAFLSLVARRQIQNAEGTRSGAALAASAWWISLLFGVSYIALYLGTYLAVWWQAERFTDTWIDHVRNGRLEEAFLLTRSPIDRKDENAKEVNRLWMRFGRGQKDELSGPLPRFMESEIVRVIQTPGAKIENTGTRRWDYEQRSYYVDQSYRVTTDEGTFGLLLTVQSMQTKEIKGRQWQLRWKGDGDFESKTLTERGMAIDRWRRDSAPVSAAGWLGRRQGEDFIGMYLYTLPPEEMLAVSQRFAARLTANTLAATGICGGTRLGSLAPLFNRRQAPLFLDGYAKFPPPGFVRDTNFAVVGKPEDRAHMTRFVIDSLLTPKTLSIIAKQTAGRPLLSEDPQRVRMGQEVVINGFEPVDGQMKERFACEGWLIVESDPGEVTLRRQPFWRVIGLELRRGGPPPRAPQKQRSEDD